MHEKKCGQQVRSKRKVICSGWLNNWNKIKCEDQYLPNEMRLRRIKIYIEVALVNDRDRRHHPEKQRELSQHVWGVRAGAEIDHAVSEWCGDCWRRGALGSREKTSGLSTSSSTYNSILASIFFLNEKDLQFLFIFALRPIPRSSIPFSVSILVMQAQCSIETPAYLASR